ncbi:polyprenyl synthetase family protein [Amycolatopsis regifaucium]|uniref:Geranylgeranyl pyrophosphate synthase n=1 Tax=Amycolatopsis regifaucium TaxID=546365 RepID=A0A154MVF7_9PSEU|nr:polyprenyl synthetase family protein [Amycolatopsis regifaucium]KZB88275.1 geranylgeranyl pyrophosphate synthase [Amycolatopsis regifaucium]OKA11515.1 geranylgeranyl pyrophosphate synthase [Amycolatopsis regifaucium]SFH43071.1 geranylgeranyl diphosphate synthase, type I [Amycolatopsis regifaucium]
MASTMAAEEAPSKEAPAGWLDAVGARCLAEARGFVEARAAEHFSGRAEGELAETVIPQFLAGGKFLRPMFAYVGWRCGGPESDAAVRAAASLELLHCFALAQDDVMDGSALRRGRPALHVRFSRWHAEQRWSGSADRFGESAAILAGDLFLVWSEQLLRESGLAAEALSRGWPRYDAMRAELAVGQLADLVNDARTLPGWDSLLDVLRRKSGNYTVRRPLEFGAALAGCGPDVLAALTEYGGLVGEAFQFKDDLLGVFGDPAVTGKPSGQDLRDRKASSVVVLAAEMADRAQHDELGELLNLVTVDDDAVSRWCGLIAATGARERLGELIRERADKAQAVIDAAVVPRQAADALALLATRCTEREQ